MTVNHAETARAGETTSSLQPYLLRFVAVIAALLIVIPLLPALITNFAYSFSGHAPKIYWYLSRSAGFVALTILWISMALGLGISNKMARLWPGAPTAFAMHEYASLLGLAFAVYHALVLMGDHFVDFSLPRLLTPFSIAWKPFWIGLGQLSFYFWVIAAVSFYVRRFIGQKTWRLIHYVNFATYMMGLFHGLFTGSDSTANWANWYYWASAGSLLTLLAYRIYDSALKNKISLREFAQQHIQKLLQSPMGTRAKRMKAATASKVRSVPEALLREQSHALAGGKTILPPITTSIPAQPESESAPPISAALDEKTAPQTPEAAVVPDQTVAQAESLSEAPAVPEVKATSLSPAVRLDKTYHNDKVRVRIFREPTTRPIIIESDEDAGNSQEGTNTLIIKMKKNFLAIPVQPTTPNRGTRRIVFSED